jgi:hypothetical protein
MSLRVPFAPIMRSFVMRVENIFFTFSFRLDTTLFTLWSHLIGYGGGIL